MNKAQLIDAIASEAGLTKVQAKKALDAFMNVTGKALQNGESITLVGFGTFKVKNKLARKGRNPRTGAVIEIKARKAVSFAAGSELNACVN